MSSLDSSLIPQFISKNILYILGMTALFHVLAAVVLGSWVSGVVLGVILIATAVLTAYRMEWGIALAWFEILVGAHGHLVTLAPLGIPVSLRMAIFFGVFAGWLYVFLRKREVRDRCLTQGRDRKMLPFGALLVVVAYGALRGFFTGNGLGALFDDANTYVTLLYLLPLASIAWTQDTKRLMITTFFAGVLWIALFTVALSYAFTHIAPERIWDLYVLVRDTRMFEITLLSAPAWFTHTLFRGEWYFRIFSQAQIFLPLFFIMALSALFFAHVQKVVHVSFVIWGALTLVVAAAILGGSRSFLLGIVAVLGVFAGVWLWAWVRERLSRGMLRVAIARKLALALSCVCAVCAVWLTISFPFPSRPDLTTSPFYRGDHDTTRGLAISSRWNMLSPLFARVSSSPVLGQGFGEEITYISDDPRIREMTGGTGSLTTYRFEWGFLDVWLKMGIAGLFVHVWLLWILGIRPLIFARDTSQAWLATGLALGVVMLFVVHMFTPYLNHPTGIMFLLLSAFLLPIIPRRNEKALSSSRNASQSSRWMISPPAPVMRLPK